MKLNIDRAAPGSTFNLAGDCGCITVAVPHTELGPVPDLTFSSGPNGREGLR